MYLVRHMTGTASELGLRVTSCRVVYDLCLTLAARATKVAYDSRKQKSYPVNKALDYSKTIHEIVK